jgi:hypothetical protein
MACANWHARWRRFPEWPGHSRYRPSSAARAAHRCAPGKYPDPADWRTRRDCGTATLPLHPEQVVVDHREHIVAFEALRCGERRGIEGRGGRACGIQPRDLGLDACPCSDPASGHRIHGAPSTRQRTAALECAFDEVSAELAPRNAIGRSRRYGGLFAAGSRSRDQRQAREDAQKSHTTHEVPLQMAVAGWAGVYRSDQPVYSMCKPVLEPDLGGRMEGGGGDRRHFLTLTAALSGCRPGAPPPGDRPPATRIANGASASELVVGLRSGRISATQLTQHYLETLRATRSPGP